MLAKEIFLRAYWLLSASLIFWGLNLDTFTFANFYDQKRLLQVIFLVFSVSLLLLENFRASVALLLLSIPKKVLILISVFLLSGFVSASLSNQSYFSQREFLNTFLLFISVFIVSVAVKQDFLGLKAFSVIVLLGFLLVLMKFILSLISAIHHEDMIFSHMVFTGVVNVNFMGQLLGILIPLLTFLLGRVDSLYKPILFFLLCGCCLMVLVGSIRSIPFSLFIASLVLLFANRKLGFIFIARILLAFLCSFTVFFYINSLAGGSGKDILVADLVSSAGRYELWMQALAEVRYDSLFGVSPFGLALISNSLSTAHPHNIAIQLLVEWGWLSFATCFFLVLYLFAQGFKRLSLSEKPNLLFVAAFVALIEASVHSMLSGVLVMPMSQMFFVCIAGICLSQVRLMPSKQITQSVIQNAGKYLLTIVLCALFTYVFLVFKTYPEQGDVSMCTENLSPRFWLLERLRDCG